MTDITSTSETYKIAHTAQCKLHLSAKRPDRNLRFLLGHAFTLDKLMLRIVEIEDEEKIVAEARKNAAPPDQPRRVSFVDNSIRPSSDYNCAAAVPDIEPKTTMMAGRKGGRAPSPPPDRSIAARDSDTSSDDYDMDDEDEGLGLSLTTSHIARPPPNLIPDDDADNDDEEGDGAISPPWTPTESQLATIVEEEPDEVLAGIYETIRGCGCMASEKAPVIEKIWEVPGEKTELGDGRRRALVAIRA